MKLVQLDLKAYGSFTDRNIEFPADKGLHLICGNNEAGKSGALRALTTGLYGFPHKTSDNFLHGDSDLRVGMVLRHSDGSEQHFVRRKGRKDTLLNSSGDAVADDSLAKYLGPVTQEVFLKMFGLTLDELVDGGRALAAGGGELGVSLFAAGGGIGDLRAILGQLESEAAELFTPQAQKRKLNALLSEHKKLVKAAKETSLSVATWQKLDTQLSKRAQGVAEVDAELRDRQATALRLEHILKVAPLVGELAEAERKLRDLGDVMVLPADFCEARRANEKELRGATAMLTATRERLVAVEQAIAEITSPGDLLEHEPKIEALFQESGNYSQGLSQLPRLEPDLKRLIQQRDEAIGQLTSQGEAKQMADLSLSTPHQAQIVELVASHLTLRAKLDAAEEELSTAEDALRGSEAQSGNAQSPHDLAELADYLEELAEEGITQKRQTALAQQVESESGNLDTRLARLGLWSGTLAAFETVGGIPTEGEVSGFERRESDLSARMRQLAQQLADEQATQGGLSSQITALQSGNNVKTEQDLLDSRARREEGWQLVRRSWLSSEDVSEELTRYAPQSNDLAGAYAASVSGADSVGDALRSESERSAQLTALLGQQAACAKKIATLDEQLATVKGEEKQFNNEWTATWQAAGIAPRSLSAMKEWIQERKRILEEAEKLRGLRGQLGFADDALKSATGTLSGMLSAAGQTLAGNASFDKLLQSAKTLLSRNRELVAEQQKREALLQSARTAVTTRRHQLERGKAKGEEWRQEWLAALKPTWLPTATTATQAAAILKGMEDVYALQQAIEKDESRIRAIKSDHARFRQAVEALSHAVSRPVGQTEHADFVSHLQRDVKEALKQQTSLEEKEKSRADLSATVLEQAAKASAAGEALQAQVKLAKCNAPADLPEAETRSAACGSLRASADELRKRIAQLAGQQDVDAFIKEVEESDTAEAAVALEALRDDIEKMAAEKSAGDQEIGALRNELKTMADGAGAGEAAEKIQGVLADIRLASEEYARLCISAAILRKEIERYREENQGPVMKRASEIFQILTLGSFNGLTSDFNSKDEQILVGERAGKRVGVEGMSDGTRDQLFLALRLASLECRSAATEPMPLVLDDILVNFDDPRSIACLKILAELSATTQVILFTHHRHVLDLAHDKLDSSQYAVHEL